jgi:hypothetical protein
MFDTLITKNGNKTQTTGGKDEPNIVLIRTLQRTSRHGAHEGLKVSTYKTPVFKNYKVVITIRVTAMKYPYLK